MLISYKKNTNTEKTRTEAAHMIRKIKNTTNRSKHTKYSKETKIKNKILNKLIFTKAIQQYKNADSIKRNNNFINNNNCT